VDDHDLLLSEQRPPIPLRCGPTTPTQLSPRVDRRTGSGHEANCGWGKASESAPGTSSARGGLGGRLALSRVNGRVSQGAVEDHDLKRSQRQPPHPLRCRPTTSTQLSPRVDRRTGSGHVPPPAALPRTDPPRPRSNRSLPDHAPPASDSRPPTTATAPQPTAADTPAAADTHQTLPRTPPTAPEPGPALGCSSSVSLLVEPKRESLDQLTGLAEDFEPNPSNHGRSDGRLGITRDSA